LKGEADVDDYHIGGTRAVSCPDGVCRDNQIGGRRSIYQHSITQLNGVTNLTFSRARDTNDTLDYPFATPGNTQSIIVAFGSSNTLAYHGVSNRASGTFVVPTYSASQPPPTGGVTPWTYSPATFLASFNGLRGPHSLKSLVWNTDLADGAAAYAKTCPKVTSTAVSRAKDFASRRKVAYTTAYANSVGETVATATGKPAATVWNQENQYFNCAANTCASGKNCKHYLQIVWSSTSQVGCAGATCTTGSPFGATNGGTWNVLVCRWNPSAKSSGRPFPSGSC